MVAGGQADLFQKLTIYYTPLGMKQWTRSRAPGCSALDDDEA